MPVEDYLIAEDNIPVSYQLTNNEICYSMTNDKSNGSDDDD